MKMITAIIKPFELDDLRQGLSEAGIQGLTVTRVQGFGRHRGAGERYRGAEYVVDFLPEPKLEVAVPDSRLVDTVALIRGVANTHRTGEGKILVQDLLRVVRIRTGEQDEAAL